MRTSPNKPTRLHRRAWTGWLALSLSALAFLLWATFPTTDTPSRLPRASASAPLTPARQTWSREQWDAWAREHVDPALDEADAADAAAVERALSVIHSAFDTYRAGVPAFCDDLSSWGTRAGVVKRTVRGWFAGGGKASVESYARDKFEHHVLPQNALNSAITRARETLAIDLEANRNILRARLDAALARTLDPHDPALHHLTDVRARFDDALATALGRRAASSVGSGVIAFVAGTAGSILAEQAVAQIIARAGVSAAAGAAGAGGAAGAAGGPVGVAVGLGVGLVVGAGIDWWMTEEFKEKVSAETLAYLNGLEARVVDGMDGAPGVREAFVTSVNEARKARRDALANAVEEAAR